MLAEYERRIVAKAEANAATLPGPLKNAFLASPLEVGWITLEVATAAHIIVLDHIGSPFFKALFADEETRQSLSATCDDVCQAAFVFASPISVVREELTRGRESFRAAAMSQIADKCSPDDIPKLEASVVKLLTDGISTWIGYEAKATPEDGTVTHRSPGGSDDGLCWWLNLLCRVARTFPQFSWKEIQDEMPLAKLWALHAWSVENDSWGGAERSTPGYVGQELKERLKAKEKA